ncbi:hypothetical protein [Pseudobacteriovorax antillogorgiicola]|uniref:FlgN protein n=1 Tax=Pseudobacteriovorax antillogorgiicola TaxID=1513793 RepID=A0A1Y6B3M1_9BACT|nr:hypothetical protein [Pseudobacteriovorax antillogorgiicola]TCS59531.1 hypothetical protein EDD56_101451 [Pseudobacteriovorax antillogorgiicola]SME87823.1 hypothetical protein SAMN06296036_10134 [Pseudobacteriovorax antillogorgiicola]
MAPYGEIIADISRLREFIESLSELYQRTLSLIDTEHQSIQSSDLKAIGETVKAKQSLAEELKTVTDRIGDGFAKVKGYPCLASILEHRGYSHAIDLGLFLSLLADHTFGDSIEERVLRHECVKTLKVYEKYQDLQKRFQPKIEMNRYLIQKLLYHHQETFRFWQSIAAESEATYGSKGVAKPGPAQATLRVRT